MSSFNAFEDLFSMSQSSICSNGDLSLKKLFANPYNLKVEDKINWICPKIGDKVDVISFDTQIDVHECVRVCKLPYLTVKEVFPHIVGVGNDRYCWAYEISVEETHLMFLQYHYRIIEDFC